jgi:hypothetical protein
MELTLRQGSDPSTCATIRIKGFHETAPFRRLTPEPRERSIGQQR